ASEVKRSGGNQIMSRWQSAEIRLYCICFDSLRRTDNKLPGALANGLRGQSARGRLAQPRPGVEAEEGAPTNRIPLRSERCRLADHLQVAPHFGEATP